MVRKYFRMPLCYDAGGVLGLNEAPLRQRIIIKDILVPMDTCLIPQNHYRALQHAQGQHLHYYDTCPEAGPYQPLSSFGLCFTISNCGVR